MAGRCRILVVVSVAAAWGAGVLATAGAASGAAVPAVRPAVPAAGLWGRAVALPGLAALNKGRYAEVESVSCGSVGNCATGGFYHGRGSHQQGFVATELAGRWGRAVEVPGLGALNKGGFAEVGSVSCVSAGNCAAVGYLRGQGFVVSERAGRWGLAVEMPGLAALNKGGLARVFSVSCGSPGNCAAGGNYTEKGGEQDQQAFVTVERNGRWGQAAQVPGAARTKGQFYVTVSSVSCTPAGPCTAGGYYLGGPTGGFVVSEKKGRWGQAIKLAAPVPKVNGAEIFSVSCPAPSNCGAGGFYLDHGFAAHGIVVSEKNGRWGRAIAVPGLTALAGKQNSAQVFSVSCAAPGSCTAAGGDSAQQNFVTTGGH